MVGNGEGSSRGIGPHWITNLVADFTLFRRKGEPNHDVHPMENPFLGKGSLKNSSDKFHREPIGSVLKINGIELSRVPLIDLIEEAALVKCYVLGDLPKDPEKEEVNRTKDSL